MSERAVYRPTGVVNFRRVVPGFVAQLLPVLLLGAALCVLDRVGLYFWIIGPLLVAIPFAFASSAVAGWTGWRHPQVAATVGFVLGAMAYMSRFYAFMLYIDGPGAFWRLDVLPDVIDWHMHNLVDGETGEIDVTKNWAFTLIEMGIVAVMFAALHHEAAKHPYCPVCGGGLKRKSSLLPPEFGTALAVGLLEDRMDELPQDPTAGEVEGNDWATVDVMYCFHGRAEHEPTFFLTLTETRYRQGQGIKAVLLDKVQVTADEMIALGEKCPALAIGAGDSASRVEAEGNTDLH